MRHGLFIGIFAAVALWVGASPARAGRLYGSATVNYTHTENAGDRTVVNPDSLGLDSIFGRSITTEDYDEESLFLNYDDFLFYKNRIRLGANLYRRRLADSDAREFRPIYLFSLTSFGYALSASYAPYKQLSRFRPDPATGEYSYIYYRDWRSTFSLNYPKWPTLGLVYNRGTATDRAPERSRDDVTRNIILESRYYRGSAAARVSYNDLKQEQRAGVGNGINTKAYSGSASLSKAFMGRGYASSTYSYYDTRSDIFGEGSLRPTNAATHTFTTLLNAGPVSNFSATASYSGRFYRNRIESISNSEDNQLFTGQLGYMPASYLSLAALKAYQIAARRTENDVVEYVTLSAALTKALRQGVDTRFNVARTIFQQSSQQVRASDSSGRYTLDTYGGSLGLDPFGHFRTLLDMTISRNSAPIIDSQRYQLSYSLNAILGVSRHVDIRMTATALSQGSKIRFGHTYSQDYNIGLSYNPMSNLNVNITYIYSILNTAAQIKNGSFSGYANYSFRRAFSLYASYLRQEQEAATIIPGINPELVKLRPYTFNGQLLIYMSLRTTFSVGYLYSKTPTPTGLTTASKSIQAQLNMQL